MTCSKTARPAPLLQLAWHLLHKLSPINFRLKIRTTIMTHNLHGISMLIARSTFRGPWAVGPRNVDRAINDLSNDYFIKDLQFPTMLNFRRLLVFEIISCDLSDCSDWPINSHEHLPCERTLCSHWTTG